jgi:hypothetical protein
MTHGLLTRMLPGHQPVDARTPPGRLESVMSAPRSQTDTHLASLAAAWMARGSRAGERELQDGEDALAVEMLVQRHAPPAPASNGQPIAQPASLDAAALVRCGQQAAREGNRSIARRLFLEALDVDPHYEDAWLWLAGTTEDPQESRHCLEFVLSRNPGNQRARHGLAALDAQHA